MVDWMPKTNGITKRNWRPSGAKNGEVKVRTTHDLYKDALMDLLKELDFDATRIVMQFPAGPPQGLTKEHYTLLMQIFAYNRVRPMGTENHVKFMLPKLNADAQRALVNLYQACRIYIKEA